MNKFKQILSSKVFWTALVGFIINVLFPAVKIYIPVEYIGLIDAILGIMATLFHVTDVNDAAAGKATSITPER